MQNASQPLTDIGVKVIHFWTSFML